MANYLACSLMTLKKLHPISETMNSTENKQKRIAFVLTLRQFQSEYRAIVWIDESNFNLFCCLARAVMTSSKGKNLRMICVLCSQGIMKFTTKRGSYNSMSCKNWVHELICSLRDREIENPVTVCDNASCHSGLEQIFTGKKIPSCHSATLKVLIPGS